MVSDDWAIVHADPDNTGIVTVKYNDYNRKLTLNAKSFTAAGITSTTNTITIVDHGFTKGQKVIHTATTPTYG